MFGYTGGFVAQNSGEINDCFTLVKLNNKKDTSGGFSGENTGGISRSFHSSYNMPESKDEAEKLGFDTENIWDYKSQAMRFVPEKWLFNAAQSKLYQKYIKDDGQAEITLIETAEELFDLARAVNGGDRKLASAYIKLGSDIDLGGKEWEPIGVDLSKAFSGLFDGSGFTVKNFVIKSKQVNAKGFFGYLKGEAYNLTVDCNIKGGTAAGGIAAYCEGVIGCCAALTNIRLKRGDAKCGGLAGINTGKIFHSYAAGKIAVQIINPKILLPLLLLLIALPLTWALLELGGGDGERLPIYAPVPTDSHIERIPNERIRPATGQNSASFQFDRLININLSTGECLFNFRNPGSSNHDIVVQLQITDAQAVLIMGSTGRTAEAQQRLDAHPDYDPENHRVILAESGAVPPGYGLEFMRLAEQPDGAALPPGEYDAIIFMLFYDIETHSRAMLESQLPVIISVSE